MDTNTVPLHELITDLRNKAKPFPLDMFLLLVVKADTVAALNYYDGAKELAKYLGPIESPDCSHLAYARQLVTWDILEITSILGYPASTSKVKAVLHTLLSLYSRELI
jgi:hypothetical protein